MASSRRDNESSFGVFLSDNMLKSGIFCPRFIFFYIYFRIDRDVGRKWIGSGEDSNKRSKVLNPDKVDPRNERRFFKIFHREKHIFDHVLLGKYDRWKNSVDASKLSIESEFSNEETVFHVFSEKIMFPAEYPNRDGEIKTRSFFSYIRRSQIDRYTCGWKSKPRVLESASHPFFAFLNSRIGKPNYIEGGKTVAYVELDIYLISGESIDRYGKNF